MERLSIFSLLNILINIFCIIFLWRILLNIKFEVIFKKDKQSQVYLLLLILAIILGHQLASFFISYLNWSEMLGGFF